MKKKRLIELGAAVVLSSTAVVGGTLAYFTDTDEKTNNFTFGNVDIELVEDFIDGSQLVPTATENTNLHVKKEVTIKNKGTDDAYIWAEILVPADLDDGVYATKNDSLHLVFDEGVTVEDLGATSDGKYNVYRCYKETEAIASGDDTSVLLKAVYMDEAVEQVKNGDEIVKGTYKLIDGSTYSDSWDVIVKAFGMQTVGFNSLKDAIDNFPQAQAD